MKKIAVLISGGGSNLQAIIDKCASGYINAEIACVISNNPHAYGLERAKVANIPIKVLNHKNYASRLLYDDELSLFLEQLDVDLIVLAGFMRILSSKIADYYYGRMINIHPSLLPRLKGLDTHSRAIKAKHKYTGCTVHYVNNDLDSGEIIIQKKIKIFKHDNPQSLSLRVLKLEHEAYIEALEKII